MTEPASKYWLDQTVAEIIRAHPQGEIAVASGVSPSGPYHVGRLREVITADALAWALRRAGRAAKHLHFVDDFDYFRKIPAGVPEEFDQHIGTPVYLVPDPDGCHDSYADHHLQDFLKTTERMNLDMEIFRAHKLYQSGKFKDAIKQVASKLADVRRVITDVSGRALEADWTPFQILEDNKLVDLEASQLDKIESADSGQIKLDWRLDWPARWSIWEVQVEPFGKDHATKGGSYDTGKELVRAVFDTEPPYPVPYEFINLVGETKKMSGSAGGVVTASEALEIMPAEVLRYFVLRSRPDRQLFFDTGVGLYNLIEEYSQVESAVKAGQDHEFRGAYAAASSETPRQTISSVPFSHLVAAYQAALGKPAAVFEILERTGYEAAVKAEREILAREFNYVEQWLAKYAPDSVKFQVQDKLPDVELSAEQRSFLAKLAEGIEREADLTGQGMHDLVYATAEQIGVKPAQAFQAIYRVILGKDSGPKAGWFLASLDQEWLITRFRSAAKT
jgi:lysyl-tRNA synthetase class 1